MNDLASADGSRRASFTERPRAAPPMELWRLRGAMVDLRGLAFETSYGYALGLELDTELLMLHLQPSLEVLVATAERIETALIAQGWRVMLAPSGRSDRP